MIAVINASPLISLAVIDQLDILREIFSTVYVPFHVYNEVVDDKNERRGAELLKTKDWLEVVTVSNKSSVDLLSYQLDRGEAEVITLGYELKPDFLIIDELKGRKMAKHLNIDVIGTLGLLLMAKEMRLINEVKPFMNQLLEKGIWISTKLYSEVMALADEKE